MIRNNDFFEARENNISNVFIDSLNNLTPDDITKEKPQSQRSLYAKIFNYIRIFMISICVCVLCGSLFYIVRSLAGYKRADEIYNTIADDFFDSEYSSNGSVSYMSPLRQSAATPDYASCQSLTEDDYKNISSGSTYSAEFARIKSKLYELKQKYPDIYGWIKIDDTTINYPMVQCDNNEYYLTHAYTGEYLPAGSIFVDRRCYENLMQNYNLVIYGHHMSSGTMFNHLDKFFNEKFFNEHPYITIYTLDGIYTYKIFAIYETDMYDKYIKTGFSSRSEFIEFAEEMQSRSVFVREGISFDEYDRIITLSTCTNRLASQRISLQAVLVDTKK